MKTLIDKPGDEWTHYDLCAARSRLKLTPQEAANVLEMGPKKSIYRIESEASNSQSRQPPARAVRLYKAYLSGYRPADWPERLARIEAEAEQFKREAVK